MRLRFFSILTFFIFTLEANAAPRVPTKVVNLSPAVSLGKFLKEARGKTDEAAANQGWLPMKLQNPIALRMMAPPLGVIDFRLTKVDPVTGLAPGEKPRILLFHGTARVRNRLQEARASLPRHITIPASGSLIRNTFELSLAWPGPYATRYLRLLLPLERGRKLVQVGRASNVSGFVFAGRPCGLGNISPLSMFESAQAIVAASEETAKRAEIVIDCDYDCGVKLGGGSAARDKLGGRFMPIVNSVYRSIGLQLVALDYIVRPNSDAYPTSITNKDDFLDTFLRESASLPYAGRVDFKHLITGRDRDQYGDTIGLSFYGIQEEGPGVTCRHPEYSIGWSQHFNETLTPYIIAHELGHNLSADHTSSGLMMPALGGSNSPTEFSAISTNQIQSYIAAHGDCFDEGASSSSGSGGSSSGGFDNDGTGGGRDSGPHPTLTASYRRMSFRASVSIPAGYSSCSLHLLGGKTRAAIYSRPVQLAVTAIDSDTPAFYSATLLGVRPSPTSKPIRAFISAQVQCAEGAFVPSTRGVKLTDGSRIVRRGQYKSSTRWLKALAGLL